MINSRLEKEYMDIFANDLKQTGYVYVLLGKKLIVEKCIYFTEAQRYDLWSKQVPYNLIVKNNGEKSFLAPESGYMSRDGRDSAVFMTYPNKYDRQKSGWAEIDKVVLYDRFFPAYFAFEREDDKARKVITEWAEKKLEEQQRAVRVYTGFVDTAKNAEFTEVNNV